jgi:4-amino-4-deoxy-L-arabinose transferase-like glycosyltransferase
MRQVMSTPRRPLAIVLAAGIAGWLVLVAMTLGADPPLGHDEAQYAIAAQDLIEGKPVRWTYLSVGMDAFALPGVLLGGSELALRIMPALAGLALLLAAGWLARAAAGDAAAAWTVAVIAATHSIARRAAELLSDIPSTACLLAGTAIVMTELLREDGPRRRLLLAAPCLAATFYLRYGSVLAIAAISVPALVVGWRGVARRPGLAAGTIALFALLLAPSFLLAKATTGSALGIFLDSREVLGDQYVGQSVVTYMTSNPFLFYGMVTTPVMLAGLIAIRRARDRRVLLLWLIAVADIVAVGLTPVAQSRYVFLGIVLLVVLGVDEISRWVTARPPKVRRVLGGFAGVAVAASWVTVAVFTYTLDGSRARRSAPTLAAIAAIRDDARGAPCLAIGRRSTQLQWYTGCVSVHFAEPEEIANYRVYLVHEPGGEHQPPLTDRAGVPRTLIERPELIVLRYDAP